MSQEIATFSHEVWSRYTTTSSTAVRASLKRILIDSDQVQDNGSLAYVGGWLSNLPRGRKNIDIYLAIMSCMANGLTHKPNVTFGEACKEIRSRGLANKEGEYPFDKKFNQLVAKDDLYDFLLNLRRTIQEHKSLSCDLDKLIRDIRGRFMYQNESDTWVRHYYI